VIALLSAVLLVLVFPGFNLNFLAPFALIPLFYMLDRKPNVWYAYATGVLFWFGLCYWIQFTLANHGGTGEAGGWALFVLFSLAKGIQMAVFGWLAARALRTPWAVPATAALWTFFEWTHQYTGFTWLILGNATIDWPYITRLAPYTGVYGISFALALVSAVVVKCNLTERQAKPPVPHLAWLALLLIPAFLPSLPPSQTGRQIALVLQPNLPEEEQWTERSTELLDRHLAELSTPRNPVDFVIWPEAPAPIYDTDAFLPSIAQNAHAAFLSGVVSRTPDGAPLNSALLLSATGSFISRYDKVNLVPFGEFVPWPFELVTRKVSSEAGDYHAGTKPIVADRVGTFICYESVFPTYIRQFSREGAQALFNISNDGWFGKSAARFQHFEIVRMRALENRRWIVRSTNNGISAAIDPAGRVMQELPPYREATAILRFNYETATTFYTDHGDWFVYLCAAFAVILESSLALRGPSPKNASSARGSSPDSEAGSLPGAIDPGRRRWRWLPRG
jgi:apolipoprotein N-acyltransferase